VSKDDAVIEHYEEIRRTSSDRHQGVAVWGLAVLRTKGMAAWVKSWGEYGEGGQRHMPPRQPTSVALNLSPNTEEVVRVLAGMVWAIQKEAVP
jgi:hypothetical protein